MKQIEFGFFPKSKTEKRINRIEENLNTLRRLNDFYPIPLKGKWFEYKIMPNDLYIPYEWMGISGNYVIILPQENQKICLYVGISENLYERSRRHWILNNNHGWKIIETEWGDKTPCLIVKVRREKYLFERLMLECRQIYKLKPIHNGDLKIQANYPIL